MPLVYGIDLSLQSPDYRPEFVDESTGSPAPSQSEKSWSSGQSWDDLVDEDKPSMEPIEKYVGLSNYSHVVGDRKFHKALVNTLVYCVSVIILVLPLAFLLAQTLFSCSRKLRPFLCLLLLLPALTLPGILSTLFHLFFHGRDGILNQVFVMPLGFEPIKWMLDPAFILPAMVMQAVWRWTGFITLFFLCAMETIPKMQYEAARLEGAGVWRTMKTVTLPGVRHIGIFAAIFLAVDAVASFSGAYSLLGGSGGTADAGLLLVTYVYQIAFPGGSGVHDFPAAAAMSLLIVPVIALATWLFLGLVQPRKVTP
ncbi:MAG: sugar ABC transporter permease [Opitutales bacterium]